MYSETWVVNKIMHFLFMNTDTKGININSRLIFIHSKIMKKNIPSLLMNLLNTYITYYLILYLITEREQLYIRNA